MFDNFKKIGPDIYLFENFLNEKENTDMFNLIKSVDEIHWHKVASAENSIFTLVTEVVEPLIIKIADICPKQLDPVYSSIVNRLGVGITYGEHKDTNNSQEMLNLANQYQEGDDFVIGNYPTYGIVYYFNDDYKEGAIYYPELNIRHKPKARDLVIHGAGILHGTEPPIDGTRYSYTAAFTKKIKMKK